MGKSIYRVIFNQGTDNPEYNGAVEKSYYTYKEALVAAKKAAEDRYVRSEAQHFGYQAMPLLKEDRWGQNSKGGYFAPYYHDDCSPRYEVYEIPLPDY